MNDEPTKPTTNHCIRFFNLARSRRLSSFFPEEEKLFVKIGMELFYQEGPEIVRYLKDAGHDVF